MSDSPDPTVTESIGADDNATRPPAKKAAKKAAPRKPKRDTAPRSPGRPTTDEKLTEQVAEQLHALGFSIVGVGAVLGSDVTAADGAAVMDHAQPIAESLVNLSKQNASVRKFLQTGVEGSAWIGVGIAVAALGRDIATNHGVFGPTTAGDQDDEPATSWQPVAPQ